jgi:glycosyltransferase involved in cell wall biosynthesis
MVPRAIESYLSQDYPNRELIVIDDGEEPIADLVVAIPRSRYFFQPFKNLSAKRNFGVRAANGKFIVHFDADDWSGPHRISDQVGSLQANPKALIAGYAKAFWYDFVTSQACYYKGFVWGATMMYHQSYALTNAWDEGCSYAEDGPFIGQAYSRQAVISADGGQNFVATMSAQTTRRPIGNPVTWPLVGVDVLPQGFRTAAGLA